jgi:hypothetical protein
MTHKNESTSGEPRWQITYKTEESGLESLTVQVEAGNIGDAKGRVTRALETKSGLGGWAITEISLCSPVEQRVDAKATCTWDGTGYRRRVAQTKYATVEASGPETAAGKFYASEEGKDVRGSQVTAIQRMA